MVLPAIPLALMAAGAVTGSGGLALGGKGALDAKRADATIKARNKEYQDRHARFQSRVQTTDEVLAGLGEQQRAAMSVVVLRMVDFLRRHRRLVNHSDFLSVDGIEVGQEQLETADGLTVDPGHWVGAALGVSAVGVGTAAGTTSLVGAVGVASTGASISGLSGAAASNATMAWLGGGALSAGGGGMALGATVLNVVVAGPALLAGGLATKSWGKKKITEADEVSAQVAVAVAEMDAKTTLLDAVDTRVAEIVQLLTDLSGRATMLLDRLEAEPFDPAVHMGRLQRAVQMVQVVKNVAEVQVLGEDGDLTAESAAVWVRYAKTESAPHGDD